MVSIDGALFDLKRLDRLAAGDSALHRLDPRAKVLATVAFLVTVVSFGRYEISAMVPFFAFPAVLVVAGDLPPRYLVRKVLLVLPFALLIGIVNPVFDRSVLLQSGPFEITGGWVSCLSIVLRAALTVSAALVLVALTGFPAICTAMQSLGMPRAFAMQLLFLYRYMFVLAEEGSQAARARELRSFGNKGRGMSSYASLLGHLLMRTWLRAERVHMAMLARGFSGTFQTAQQPRFGLAELFFVLGWSALFVVLRFNNLSQLLGMLLSGQLP